MCSTCAKLRHVESVCRPFLDTHDGPVSPIRLEDVTSADVRKNFEDEFKPHRLEYNDLESFARQLVTAGLVQQEAAGTGRHLFTRRAKQRRMKRIAAISNILYWKIPVFDPDRRLTWMYKYLWWIFTWPFFIASVGLMLAAAGHVMLHFQTFYDKLPAYDATKGAREVGTRQAQADGLELHSIVQHSGRPVAQ